jgi:hypothetical protein
VGVGRLGADAALRGVCYITNDRELTADAVLFSANDRCDHENLIAQLNGGVGALITRVDDPAGNWAYIVTGSLPWSLNAWGAPPVPVSPLREAMHLAERLKLLRIEVRDAPRGIHPGAVPVGAERRPIDLPVAVVEPAARGAPPAGGAAARLPTLLKSGPVKSGSGCPDLCGPSSREGCVMSEARPAR